MTQSSIPQDFPARLAAQQGVDQTLRKEYVSRLDGTFERANGPADQLRAGVSAAGCTALTIYFSYLAIVRHDLSPNKQVLAYGLVALGVALVALCVWKLLRRTINVRRERRAKQFIRVVGIAVVAGAILRLSFKSPDAREAQMGIADLTLLGLTVCAVQTRLLFASLRDRMDEQNLEVRYRLAELSEQFRHAR